MFFDAIEHHGNVNNSEEEASRITDIVTDPKDAPRGFDFLFSLNRLNVATSRTQAVVVVGSPRLLEAECKTPKQMRLVNGFCGAVEAAKGRVDEDRDRNITNCDS